MIDQSNSFQIVKTNLNLELLKQLLIHHKISQSSVNSYLSLAISCPLFELSKLLF